MYTYMYTYMYVCVCACVCVCVHIYIVRVVDMVLRFAGLLPIAARAQRLRSIILPIVYMRV